MVRRNSDGSLTTVEKKIVKRLLERGWRNQDIQAQINFFRKTTINSGRITEIKQDVNQRMASEEAVDFFLLKQKSYDPQTSLNLYEDERLIRSREAMVLAVQVFNSAGLKFKTEVFSVLANISWTYLLHEYYIRKGVPIIGADERSVSLSYMLNRDDCPLTGGVKNNLEAIKSIRDEVEHLLLGKSDLKWQGIYQACCLNFEKTITEMFGEKLSLASELSFALQFTKVDFEQISELNKFEIPAHIQALDARLQAKISEEELNDLDYQFRVVYTFDATSKSNAHMQFINPDSAEGKQISTVLAKTKIADELYPHKPGVVCKLVKEKTGKTLSVNNHTNAWMHFKVRPKWNSKNLKNTEKKYCIFHEAHKDYTYSNAWVELLSEAICVEKLFSKIKQVKK